MSIQTFTTVYDQLFIVNKHYFRHNGARLRFSISAIPPCPQPQTSIPSPNSIEKEENHYHKIFSAFSDIQSQGR